jgi:hypothetical protein
LGKASVTRAAALAKMKDEPIPCRTRQRIRTVVSEEKPAPRGEGEHEEAADVGALAPEQVAEAPGR